MKIVEWQYFSKTKKRKNYRISYIKRFSCFLSLNGDGRSGVLSIHRTGIHLSLSGHLFEPERIAECVWTLWYPKRGFFFLLSVLPRARFYHFVGRLYLDYYPISKFCRPKCETDIHNKILNIHHKIIEYKWQDIV